MKNLIIGSDKNIKKKTYIWTMVASLVNASESIIVLMLATRFTDLESAGILTISFTVANLLMCLGKFGMRNFQATDVKKEYEFGDYFGSRLFTMLLMFFGIGIYLIYGYFANDYSTKKIWIILFICLMYAAEAFEEVYWASYQNKQRMDVGTKMFAIRWMIAIVTLSATLVISRNAILASCLGAIINWVVLFLMIVATKSLRINDRMGFRIRKIGQLLRKCFPLCLSSLMLYYVNNASKYAIDACLNDEVQACYGFVAMPNFVIGLVNTIIYQPMLVTMSEEWNSSDIKKFSKRIKRQGFIILGLAIACILGAWLLGVPVLSWLYHTDLKDYKLELIILMCSGMCTAFSGFFMAILTTMRKVKGILFGYLFVALTAIICSNPIVRAYGTIGAAISNVVWTFLVAVNFGCQILYAIKKKRRELTD